jgi:hypothetical protein
MEELEMCPHGRHIGAVCLECGEGIIGCATRAAEAAATEVAVALEYAEEVEVKESGADGGYYVLPKKCKQLQDIIYHKQMGFERGNIFKAAYRWDVKPDLPYNLEKIIWFASYVLTKLGRDPLQSATNAKKAASLD